MGVSLQLHDHLSGGGGTAPKCYIFMVAAPEDISHRYIPLCACPGVLDLMGAVKGSGSLWVTRL